MVAFLCEDAFENQKRGVSVTYLFFIEENGARNLAGYITLLSDSIEIRQNKCLQTAFESKSIGYKTLPALKIGRIATDTRFQRRGIATAMVKFAISIALDTSVIVGCRFLIVDAKEAAEDFYLKNGFRLLKEDCLKPKQLYLDLFIN
ncbi:GNAT family N-acetyltransferase [Candidatus Micrarchaeota archaeon]|nr:GNAT family N-acetyltransferase [Candidatus Micrarchaeota archaeon]